MNISRSLVVSLLALLFASMLPLRGAQAQQLFVSINPTSFSESAGSNAATGSITRSTATTSALNVTLTSSNNNYAKVPANLTIPAGASFATFSVTAVDDMIVSGPHTVTITARASGFTSGTQNVTVTESDVPTLDLSISPRTFSEGAGANAALGTVTRNTATSSALNVTLSSSSTGAATVPTSVTIPAGSTSANFPIGAVDNNVVDGSRSVTITASSSGFTPATKTVTVTDNDVATLTLSANPTTFSEAAGANAATGTVTRNTSTASALVVNLASSNTAKVTVPATVTIPVNATSATFPIAAVDNTIVDGPQSVTITAAVAGYNTPSVPVTVTDNDVATLIVTTSPTTFGENAGLNAALGTVTRNTDTSTALTVNLSSNNGNQASVPATVTIPAGASSATFPVAAVDNQLVTGPTVVTIVATAVGFVTGSTQVTVNNVDVATLTLTTNVSSFSEGAGPNAAIATITRNTDTSVPLTVQLLNSNNIRVHIPTSVTFPVGANSLTFSIAAIDNNRVDGDQVVGLTALASGFAAGRARVTVLDNDVATPTPVPTPVPTATPIPAATPTPVPALTLTFTPNTFSQGTGVNAATGILSRNANIGTAVAVRLTTGNTPIASIPTSAVIPAGVESIIIPLTSGYDSRVTTTQIVGFTATASGYLPARTTVTVTPPRVLPTPIPRPTPTPRPAPPTITLSVNPSTFSEAAGARAAVGTLTRNTNTVGPLIVTLYTSNAHKAQVPSTVTIPTGATAAQFYVSAVDNTIVDGPTVVGLTAIVAGYAAGRTRVTVTDNDTTLPTPVPTATPIPAPTATPMPTATPISTPAPTPTLTLTVNPTVFSEAAGAKAATGTVARNGLTTAPLLVYLFSSDTNRVRVPATVTIGRNVTAVSFAIAAINTPAVTGSQSVTITAIASGFQASQVTVTVLNNVANQNKAAPTNLSKASAQAASSSLNLRFLVALGAETAADPASYSVTVNGKRAAVASAGYNSSQHSVTLSLAEGTLQAGDHVTVSWSGLSDAKGKAVSGTVVVVAS